MGRKKKEEPEIYHTPFGSTTVRPPEYDLSHYSIEPKTMEVASIGDPFRRYIQDPFTTGASITYTGSTGEVRSMYYPPKHWEPYSTTLDYEDFMKKYGDQKIYLASTHGSEYYDEVHFKQGDFIMFGRESSGVPENVHNAHENIRVPMIKSSDRSLNLSNTVAIAIYEGLRQIGFPNMK